MAFLGAALLLGLVAWPTASASQGCRPTPPDARGPFYGPGQRVCASVGRGYALTGRVLGAPACQPVPGARLEFWLAGPDGRYGDDYRASVVADASGACRFESHLPPAYAGRVRHVHVRASAPGYRALVTQHYAVPEPRGRAWIWCGDVKAESRRC